MARHADGCELNHDRELGECTCHVAIESDCDALAARVKVLEKALRGARTIVANTAEKRPKWVYDGILQDPSGIHALLAEIDAALTPPAQSEKEGGG